MRSHHALAVCLVALLALPVAAGAVPQSVAPAGSEPGIVAGASASAATHGDHVSVDAQASSDGTVVVETVSALGPSFVVLTTDDDGRPGEPVGNATVSAASFRRNVAVTLDDDAWGDWSGNRTFWAVLYRDDGDGRFDPESDVSVATRNPAAETEFTLGRTDGGADRVLARVFNSQRLREGRLTVRRVDLSRPGYLVATSVEGDRVLGTRALDAGTHENVTVALNESFVAEQRREFRVRLLAYRDDGDGRFDAGDRPVTVGGERVATSMVVQRVGTGADGTVTTTRPLVVTPTPGSGTATVTESPTAVPTANPTSERTDDGATVEPTSADETSASGPGFEVAGALFAALVVVAVLGRKNGV
jgi:PGF-CTERM protein